MDIDTIWDQEKQRCTVRADGELRHLVGSINELAVDWLFDKTSPFYLAGQGMAPYNGEVQTWWLAYQRGHKPSASGGEIAITGDIIARELPHKHVRLVFALRGFPDPDLFRKMIKKIVEKLEREGFAPRLPLGGDEGGKKPGPTIKIQERARVCKELKDAHPEWTQEKLAMEAGERLREILSAESVRNVYRTMGWKWKRGERIR